MAFNATKAQKSNKNNVLHQGIEIVQLGKDRLEISLLNIGILKATSENVIIQFRIKQKIWVTTQVSKNSVTTTLQIAIKCHTKKFCMQE